MTPDPLTLIGIVKELQEINRKWFDGALPAHKYIAAMEESFPAIVDSFLVLHARNAELERQVEGMREALEVCRKEAHQHYSGDEFTEANDHFRNCYLYACNALDKISPLLPR
jgi:hypothetical protein